MTNYNPFKLKPQSGWFGKTRAEKLGACMYPHLVDKSVQQEMAAILRGEGKSSPFDAEFKGRPVKYEPFKLRSK